jgi:PKD repeat protein
MYRAVIETESLSIRAENFAVSNPLGVFAFPGDTLSLQFDIINFLAPSAGAEVEIVSASPYFEILDTKQKIRSLITMESTEMIVRGVLNAETPMNELIKLRMLVQEGIYRDYQNFSFRTSGNQLTLQNEDIQFTIAGDGKLSDNGDFQAWRETVMEHGGLLLSLDNGNVYDHLISSYASEVKDQDFTDKISMRLLPSAVAAYAAFSTFESLDRQIQIEQRWLAPDEDTDVLVVYDVINSTEAAFTSLFTGLYADLNLGDGNKNRCYWEETSQALIFEDSERDFFAALSSFDPQHYQALNVSGNEPHTPDIGIDFSDAVKWQIQRGENRTSAGAQASGNDVAGLVSESFDIGPGERKSVAFILCFGRSRAELQGRLASSREKLNEFFEHPLVLEQHLTCTSNFTLDPEEGHDYAFYRDPRGHDVIKTGSSLQISSILQDTVIYAQSLDAPYQGPIYSSEIRRIDNIADFLMDSDTIYLDESVVPVTFYDQSFDAIRWQWDFGNGIQSSQRQPTILYEEPGHYEIRLSVETASGCSDETTKQLVVAERPTLPEWPGRQICPQETIYLDGNPDVLVLYDSTKERIIQKGKQLTLGPFEEDHLLWVAREVDGFLSLPAPLHIEVAPGTTDFEILPDTAATTSAMELRHEGEGQTAWYINGTFWSEENPTSFPVEENEEYLIRLQLSTDACDIIREKNFKARLSPGPIVADQLVCPGSKILIKPFSGRYFAFFEDRNYDKLIHKGQHLSIEEIEEDRIIYVASLDEGLPGPLSEASLTLDEAEISIVNRTENPMLYPNAQINLSLTGAVQSADWYIDGVFIERGLEASMWLAGPGDYTITAAGLTASDCPFSVSRTFEVLNPTVAQTSPALSFYPNPSRGEIQIPGGFDHLMIYDLRGHLVMEAKQGEQVSFPDHLSRGIYLLLCWKQDRLQSAKIKLER